MECSFCSFKTANLDITTAELTEFYNATYFRGKEYLDYLTEKKALQKNFRKRLDQVFKIIDRAKIRSVLEIGCAYGFFAEMINKTLPGINYVGLDISQEAVDYGRNHLDQNLLCQDYLQFRTDEKFTDVFLWDVLEHLPTPNLFLEKIYDDLDLEGRIYITTGDIDAFLPRLRGKNWRLIHPPSHLHYFSRNTITRMLNTNGFHVVDISYPTIYRSLRQIYFSLFMTGQKSSPMKKKILKTIPVRLHILLNTMDIMFITALKKKPAVLSRFTGR